MDSKSLGEGVYSANLILSATSKIFFIPSFSSGKASIALQCTPVPFNESEVIFKYYVHSSTYPKYQLKNLATQEFVELNMNLIKVIDKPQERTNLYRDYALKASQYFLETKKITDKQDRERQDKA